MRKLGCVNAAIATLNVHVSNKYNNIVLVHSSSARESVKNGFERIKENV